MRVRTLHVHILLCSVMAVTARADGLPFRNVADIPPPAKGGAAPVMPPVPAVQPVVGVQPGPTANPQPPKLKLAPAKKPKPPLPTVGTPDKPFNVSNQLKPQLIRLDDNENHVVYISDKLPNRISTPFKSPSVLGFDGIEYKIVGQDVYVITNSAEPVGVFIREDETLAPASQVASLTLVPQPLPGQNITLVFDKPIRYADKKAAVATDHDDEIRIALTDVAQGRIPGGYSEGTLNYGLARIGNVLVTPKKIFAGGEQDIYQYSAENVTESPVELTEQSFYHDGVKAVAFFPRIRLAPNETTTVLILADKPVEDRQK